MDSLIQDVAILDKLIREMEKINSKLENGHIIYAWRDSGRIIAELQRLRKATIEKCAKEEETTNEK